MATFVIVVPGFSGVGSAMSNRLSRPAFEASRDEGSRYFSELEGLKEDGMASKAAPG